MKSYNESVDINYNLSWSYTSDHPYRMLTVCGSGSGKTNVLLNLIKNQRLDIDEIYFYVKNPCKLIMIRKMWKIIVQSKKKRVLKVFDNIVADTESNEKLSPIFCWIVLRGRNFNILLVFISQSYFKVPRIIRLNATIEL